VQQESSTGFYCDLALNGFTTNANSNAQAAGYPSVIDSCQTGNGILRLTAAGTKATAVSVLKPFTFSANNVQKTFTMTMEYRIYGGNYGDGLAFVMFQDDPRGLNARARSGGYLGAYNEADVTSSVGITNGLFVELDTYGNGRTMQQPFLDPVNRNKHLAVLTSSNSSAQVYQTDLLEVVELDPRTRDGGTLTVSYLRENELNISLEWVAMDATGTGALSSSSFLVTDFNAESFFSQGQDITIGLTSGTGGRTQNHDVLSFAFEEGTLWPSAAPSETPTSSPITAAPTAPTVSPSSSPTSPTVSPTLSPSSSPNGQKMAKYNPDRKGRLF